MLTQVAALELAPRGTRVDEYVENTPLGRAGTPEGIADAVLFLSKAPWLAGEMLDLNGGAHTKRYPDILSRVNKLAAQ